MRAASSRFACRAFSLIEVVVAIGIFAVGMVAVIALFAPVAKSVAGASDAEAAAVVAERLHDELARRTLVAQSFAPAIALLKNSTARSHEVTVADNASGAATDPRTDARLLFASRDGTRLGAYGDVATWGSATPNDAEKFFEITLIRNETLSPLATDTATPPPIVLAYTARIRWPAFVPDNTPTNLRRALPAGYNPTASVVFDHSQQETLNIAGAIKR
jgi:prepilin-type N-terminal cleavage/methylation domain-containing protein